MGELMEALSVVFVLFILLFIGLLGIDKFMYYYNNKPGKFPRITPKFKIGDRVAAYRGQSGRHTGFIFSVDQNANGFEYTLGEDSALFNEKQIRKLVKKAK